MLYNYITLAWRNILRNKTYSLINIAGLSLGVACCLLLSLYIRDEMLYDQHHNNLDDLYVMASRFGANDEGPTLSPPIAPAIAQEVPEFKAAARMVNVGQSLFTYNNQTFYEKGGVVADSSLFNILTYTFLEGNPDQALNHPNTIVVTDKLSQKLFGSGPALNKLVTLSQNGRPPVIFRVSGVVKDQPKTYKYISFFTSMTSEGYAEYLRSDGLMNEWAGQNFFFAVARLSPGHDLKAVQKKMNAVLQKYGADDLKSHSMEKTLFLFPLGDYYLRSAMGRSPHITYLYVIGSIAVFILLIACINFMNLSTARAGKRATEIGIRKVMGAYRGTLVRHILTEAMVVVFASLLVSLVLVEISLPAFNTLTDKTITLNSGNALHFTTSLLALAVITGLLAGSYPAFYVSSFQPARVLKGNFSLANSSGWLRRSLVVFQFVIAIALVSGMIVITRQLDYMQTKDLGFDASARIILPLRTAEAKQQYENLRQALQQEPTINAVSAASYAPGMRIFTDGLFYTEGGNMDSGIPASLNSIDLGYCELLGMKLLAGRTFTDNRQMESTNKLVVNRTAAKKFGFEPTEAVGRHVYTDWQGQQFAYEIVGVIEDYHQSSLKDAIGPIMLEMPGEANNYAYMVASVHAKQLNKAVAALQRTWKTLAGGTPFEYSFLDEDIQKQYTNDYRLSGIITSFSSIAILISCLGLYGLSSYLAERRIKEIGVRKIMGASVGQIVRLVSSEFVWLIMVAVVISVPLAWCAMTEWLSGFAYRIAIDAWVFIIAGSTAFIIALITVSFESMRAAAGNPLHALRSE